MLKGNRNKEPIRDLSPRGGPTQRHMRPDGTFKTEKLPWIPLHKKMVDPDGNVVRVCFANGHTKRWTEYSSYIQHEKKKAGFIAWGECPLVTGALPAAPGDTPCPEADAQGKMPKDECCRHVKAVIEARRKVKQAKNEKFAARLASSDSALKQAIQEQTDWMRSVQTQQSGDRVFGTKKGRDGRGAE